MATKAAKKAAKKAAPGGGGAALSEGKILALVKEALVKAGSLEDDVTKISGETLLADLGFEEDTSTKYGLADFLEDYFRKKEGVIIILGLAEVNGADTVNDLADLVSAAVAASGRRMAAPAVISSVPARLRQQAEFILDHYTGKDRSVIVQFEPQNAGALQSFTANVLEGYSRRRLFASPRDLREQLLANEKGAGGDKTLKAERFSVMKPMGRATAALNKGEDLKSRRAHFKSMVQAHSGMKFLFSREQGVSAAKAKQRIFGVSGAASARVPKEDVWKFVRDSSGLDKVVGIYPNRALRVPHVMKPKTISTKAEDSKAASWGLVSSGALSVWGAYGARGKGVKVAVLDTGVDASHPDLKGKLANWSEFDPDGLVVSDKLKDARDSDLHGTHVCGTVVGGNASGRWLGMAPEAQLAVGLVLNGKNGGSDAQVLAGIDWAVELGDVDVINMSLGGLHFEVEPPPYYTRAIISCLQMGIPVITAIGNEGEQTTGSPGNDYLSFAVGATDVRDHPAGFSGGRTQVIRQSDFFQPEDLPIVYSKPDLTAPGVAVYSCVPAGLQGTKVDLPGGGSAEYMYLNGTSMATPHVTGAVALMLSALPSIRNDYAAEQRTFYLQDLLLAGAEELGESGQDHRFGFGRLDVLRSIGFAL